MQIRTLVFLIETGTKEDECLKPHIVNALRQYADDIDAGVKGLNAVDDSRYGECNIRIMHGLDDPCP